MPSNKEILEAQGYNRRRLVTAFQAGTPHGKELSLPSPFVPLIVGTILVGVMLAVAAIMGRFAPILPSGWENSTLIVVKGTGARYYTIDGTLRPVTNITSAKLLSSPGEYKTSEIDASTIEGVARGTQVGITGVPDDVPPAASLHSDLWLSCVSSTGTHTWIASTPQGTQARDAVTVTSAGHTYLLSNGIRHEIPANQVRQVLFTLGLETSKPREVSAQWLGTFREGTPLEPPTLEKAGLPVSGMPGSLGAAVLGSIIEVDEGQENQTRTYLVIGDGTLTPLSDTALKLYRISSAGTAVGNPLTASVADVATLEVTEEGPFPADWPASVSNPVPDEASPCAQLVSDSEGQLSTALVSLGESELSQALSNTPTKTDTPASGDTSSAAASTSGDSVHVKGGSGALVRANSGGTLGAVMLVSEAGTLHGLGENPEATLARLGYTSENVLAIPAAWTTLIPEGTSLDPAGVWATVGRR